MTEPPTGTVTGDGFHAMFATAQDPLDAAVAMQPGLGEEAFGVTGPEGPGNLPRPVTSLVGREREKAFAAWRREPQSLKADTND